jgi:hypothetical protein
MGSIGRADSQVSEVMNSCTETLATSVFLSSLVPMTESAFTSVESSEG